MMLQKSRSTFNTNRCCALTNRCRVLFSITAVPVMDIWLLRGHLPLLLLLFSLQRPTESSEVIVRSNINLASDSFDDQYQGCIQQVMEKLNQGDYFTNEIENDRIYSRAWHNAYLNWLNQVKTPLPKNMTNAHAVAILVYTLNSNVRSNFTKAMAIAGRSPQQYKDSFHFKYLHYYLTSAIQLLREENVKKNDSLCYEVYHEAKDIYLEASIGSTLQFGQFLSTSLLKEEAQKFGNQTQFTIFTCLGVSVQDFSLKKEVLIPPYELFEVVNISYYQRGNWLKLRSTGNHSKFNCELLKASSEKCIPIPVLTATLPLLTIAIISSKTGE
ncbi:ecto-ADP-ribosyltransferase 4 [Erinaceus europaeus]|uniref:NAD(P)(+)--arginine ADP-ribosyltransferase n=1 Tax=Erinaceus europaeus TaxID=9365 RepID=A0A1S3AD53_ERIEU|nr:ecto-ADP-ribosyltransferase 4 [Erinaceus europaeus]